MPPHIMPFYNVFLTIYISDFGSNFESGSAIPGILRCADKLTNEPVMCAVLEKETLASQPALFLFFHRMDETSLEQFNQIMCELRKMAYLYPSP